MALPWPAFVDQVRLPLPDWQSDRSLFASDVASDPLYREGYHEFAKTYFAEGDCDPELFHRYNRIKLGLDGSNST